MMGAKRNHKAMKSITCKECGVVVIGYGWQLFCSRSCQSKNAKRRATSRCDHCGIRFPGLSRKYCSEKCKTQADGYHVHRRACVICGATFNGNAQQRYCSVRCKGTGDARERAIKSGTQQLAEVIRRAK